MTLLAYHLQDHQLELITDSLAYTDAAAQLRVTSKGAYHGHLELFSFGHGSSHLNDLFAQWLSHCDADDIDGVVPQMSDAVSRMWDSVLRVGHCPSTLYLFGASPSQGRLVGYETHFDIDLPERLRNRPIDVRVGDRAKGGDGVARFECWASDASTYRPPVPTTVEEWAELAVDFRRRETAKPVEERVLCGGRVVYTRLDAGGCHQRTIHRYDDTGDEFAQHLAGTANTAGAAHKWTGVGRNNPCPCGSGRKYKHCHLTAPTS